MNRIINVLVPLERFIYWLLVFLLPTQLAYHFWPDYSFVFGIRIDYLSPTVYLTDILIFLLMVVSYHKLKHKINQKLKIKKSRVVLIRYIIITVVIVLANVIVSKQPLVALLKWIKIFEVSLFGVYVFLNKESYEITLSALYYSILFFCFIGIFQFVLQRSIGTIFYLFGERSFFVKTPGIALTSLAGREYLRTYSTFPHPNAFAGFLGAGTTLVLLLNSQLKIFKKRKLWLFVLVSSTAFILTFSLGAIISGILILLSYLFFVGKNNLTGKSIKKIFCVVVFLSLLMIALPKLITNKSFLSESVTLRVQQAGIAGKMFINNSVFGVGLNNFIPSIRENIISGTSLFLQPVHNIYLLLLTETGVVGFVAFIYLTVKLLSYKINVVYILPIIFVILTGFFDHYWFTLQQNQLLLAILLGISLKKNKI